MHTVIPITATCAVCRKGQIQEEGSSLGHLIHRFFASFLVRPFHSITRQAGPDCCALDHNQGLLDPRPEIEALRNPQSRMNPHKLEETSLGLPWEGT